MDRNSPWGMVVHSPSEWDISQLHQGGVAFLRIDIRWDAVQPANNGPFVWKPFDDIVRWASDRGVWIYCNLGGTPSWAVDPARLRADGYKYLPSAYPAQNLALWDSYVSAVVSRYRGKILDWGIWNEPDSHDEPANVCFWRGSMTEFFDGVMTHAVNTIHRVAPGANICAPDLAKADQTGWMDELLRRFGTGIHAVTIHAYNGTGTGTDVIKRAKTARGVVDAYNTAHGTHVELWITETGWKNTEHSESDIADQYQNLCAAVRGNPWVKKVFPYVWHPDATDEFSFKSGVRQIRQQWNGYKGSINAPQPAVPLERDSLLMSHNVPFSMAHGRSYDIQMTFRNTGRRSWPQHGPIRLAFGSRTAPGPRKAAADGAEPLLQEVLQGVQGIIGPPRLDLNTLVPGVPTSGQIMFSFHLTTPPVPGFYFIAWCLVDETPGDSAVFGQGFLERLPVQ